MAYKYAVYNSNLIKIKKNKIYFKFRNFYFNFIYYKYKIIK